MNQTSDQPTPVQSHSPTSASPLATAIQRYVPLLVWTIAVLALVAIPFKVISYGYLPVDDALRHCAKAVSGKDWSQILVLGDHYKIDHNFGWHVVLEQVAKTAGTDAEGLIVFSVAGLFAIITLSGLFFFKRPEAWLAALLVVSTLGNFAVASMFGRPFLLTMSVLMVLFCAWYTHRDKRPGWPTAAWISALIALAVFVHGLWYFFILPVAAFALAREYRWTAILVVGWMAGTFIGGSMTGHPFVYLMQAPVTAMNALGLHRVARTMATEFQPGAANPFVPFIIAIFLIARSVFKLNVPSITRNPAFWMVCIGWVLGMKVERFWDDWGLPSFIVLIAFELQHYFTGRLDNQSLHRVFVTFGLAAALFIAITSDLNGRWTASLTREYIKSNDPELAGWLPEDGGIFYSSDMSFFYETFYKNPKANWRYILGFEPSLMPKEDFTTYLNIMWNFGHPRAFEPWVKKMTPKDRLIIRAPAGARPAIPQLQWKYAIGNTWIGRLPK